MNIIDVLKGTGVGVSDGTKSSVRYELLVSESEDGNKTREINGWILPTFGIYGQTLTLEMQDGTTVRFRYLDHAGTVQVQGDVMPRSTAKA